MLGGTNTDFAYSIHQTQDSGYIVAGYADSFNGDVTGHHGNSGNPQHDIWIVKLGLIGNIQWQKTLGGSSVDISYDVRQTTDGGYIVAGIPVSTDGDVIGLHGSSSDYWLVKLDASGNIQWQKSLGGNGADRVMSIGQTFDGGYIMAGLTGSFDGDVTGHNVGVSSDYWIVKVDTSGSIEWQKCFGGYGADEARAVQQTTDGGYIVAGISGSNDGDVTVNLGGEDYWVMKLSSTGILQWQKSLGGIYNDEANSIQQTTDGGYIVGGWTESDDHDVTGLHHGIGCSGCFTQDYWVVKLDANGNIQWQKALGGEGSEEAYSVIQSLDGGYVVAGFSESITGDVTGHHGSAGSGYHGEDNASDFWIVKLGVVSNINETESTTAFKIYPNPTTDQLFLETNGTEVQLVNIYNITGALVNQATQLQNKNIDVSQLAQGVYIAEIKTKEGSVKRRWVKM